MYIGCIMSRISSGIYKNVLQDMVEDTITQMLMPIVKRLDKLEDTVERIKNKMTRIGDIYNDTSPTSPVSPIIIDDMDSDTSECDTLSLTEMISKMRDFPVSNTDMMFDLFANPDKHKNKHKILIHV